ncbi:MAG: TetR/AcrR family transcriptional regulator C-terminal domain-containing protein [Planctomycetaceae bacterium]
MPDDGEPVRLSRDVIVEAYLRLADAEGSDAITLRRLGSELGVDPTAVYRHFRDKDELLAVVSDRILAEATADLDDEGSWRERMEALQLSVRRAYLSHPRTMEALQLSPSAMPSASALSEYALRLLSEAGLDGEDAVLTYDTLESYTIGAALFDAAATEESLEGWRRVYGGLPREEYPHLSAAARSLYRDPDAAFAHGLRLMLDALDRTTTAREGTHVPRGGTTERSGPQGSTREGGRA